MICWNHSPRTHPSIYHRLPPQNSSRIQHRVTPYLSIIANNCPKFRQASWDFCLMKLNSNLPLIQLQIGSDRPCRQMRPFPQNRIPNIIKVTCLSLIQQDAILQLCTITYYAPISHNNVTTDIGSFSDLTIRSNYCWAFDHSSMLDHRPNSHYHVLLDEDRSYQSSFHSLLFWNGLDVIL